MTHAQQTQVVEVIRHPWRHRSRQP
jgi:hypothetical protein